MERIFNFIFGTIKKTTIFGVWGFFIMGMLILAILQFPTWPTAIFLLVFFNLL